MNVADKKLAAPCGLYCGACGVYIATQENDLEALKGIAQRLNQTLENTYCDGCRSDRKSAHCKEICTFTPCTEQKNIDFCGSCNEYPCTDLKNFQAQLPHRSEMWQSHAQIKAEGYEKWANEMYQKYLCPDCGTINGTYNVACRKCGKTPSCAFVSTHLNEITEYFGRLKKQ